MRAEFTERLSVLIGEASALMRALIYTCEDPTISDEAEAWLKKVEYVYRTESVKDKRDSEREERGGAKKDREVS